MGIKFTITKKFGRCGEDKSEVNGVSSNTVRKTLRELCPSKDFHNVKDLVSKLIRHSSVPVTMPYNSGKEQGELMISVDKDVGTGTTISGSDEVSHSADSTSSGE